MGDELIVLVTAPADDSADRIADALVSERLAACVNILPGIHSVYRWEGKVARDRESLLIIKTTSGRYAALEGRVRQMHSYTTPEVVAVKIERGSADYLKWLSESTAE